MARMIKSMETAYLQPSLEMVEKVFAEWDSPQEGRVVRSLVEEIRAKKYYLPELELIMVDEKDQILGYAMFSRFHIEGRYEDELLILTPVAVRTEYQRQHISKELIEYGFEKAAELKATRKTTIQEDLSPPPIMESSPGRAFTCRMFPA